MTKQGPQFPAQVSNIIENWKSMTIHNVKYNTSRSEHDMTFGTLKMGLFEII